MATFAGSTSPAALAALAPSITNLAAAQRAKSQAAAGLMNTLGVQFEKQKEQEARKQRNQAAQQVAEGLLKDEAFRRQVPGISTSADLVKLVGAENVIEYGMKSQQADRLAQQSAAQIALTQRQISEYDRQVKQREADEASSKAFTNLVGSMYGEGAFSQEDLMAGLKGLNSKDAASALRIYNERNPGQMLEKVEMGGRTFVVNKKTGATFDLGSGSQLDKQTEARLAALEKMDLTPEEYERQRNEILRYGASILDREGYPIEGFGGQPAAAGPFVPTEAETVLFSRLPDNIFTEDNMVDSEKLEAELAKMDFLSPEEVERMRRFAASQSVNRRREAYLKATEEQPEEEEESGGFFKRLFSGGPGPVSLPGPADEFVPSTTVAARRRSAPPAAVELPSQVMSQEQRLKADQTAFKNAKELARRKLIEKYKGKDKKQILEELEKARLDKIMSMPKTSAQTSAQRKAHELLKNMFQMPPFVEQYGLDELPSEIAKFVRDMIPVTERERMRREQSNRNQSTVTPVE